MRQEGVGQDLKEKETNVRRLISLIKIKSAEL